MSDVVLVAVLGLVGTVFGGFAGFAHKSRQQAVKDAEREQLQADQHNQLMAELERVNRRLDEHNGYAEKFAESSVAITALQKDVEYIKEKIK